jgi:CheY-like chemotaxis protein
MKILIVDDSRFLRLANERALVKAGHIVVTASDGEEGLRMAQERKPDLVVLDMMLAKAFWAGGAAGVAQGGGNGGHPKGSRLFVDAVEKMLTDVKAKAKAAGP